MVHFTPDRRQFLTTGLAVGLSTLCGFGVGGATLEGKTFPMPFAGSRTVANFASGLFFCEDDMPISLSHALDAGLARTDVVPDSHAEERRRAKFFAWLAVRCIAPRTLRRAGYEVLAADCKNQRDLLPGGACATAQHTIGKQYAYAHPMPRLASFAYGASAHASTSAFYASHDDIKIVTDTGTYCARALLEPLCDENANAAELATIWDFAVRAINVAIGLDSDVITRCEASSAAFPT